jgi:hypothetical protein
LTALGIIDQPNIKQYVEIEPASFAHARKTILVNELSNVDIRLANEHEAILQPLYGLDDK